MWSTRDGFPPPRRREMGRTLLVAERRKIEGPDRCALELAVVGRGEGEVELGCQRGTDEERRGEAHRAWRWGGRDVCFEVLCWTRCAGRVERAAAREIGTRERLRTSGRGVATRWERRVGSGGQSCTAVRALSEVVQDRLEPRSSPTDALGASSRFRRSCSRLRSRPGALSVFRWLYCSR